MRVSEYLYSWLNDKKIDLATSTYEAYTIYIKRHIAPYFDMLNKPLEMVTPLDLKSYVTLKRNEGRQDGKSGGLSLVSVRKHFQIIKQAFRDAVLYEFIERNPADPVRLGRSSFYSAPQFITVDRARAILSACRDTSLYPLVYITLVYGLRRSEVLGLKWQAIDFANNEMRICHTVVKNLSIVAKDTTKTRTSARTYPLLSEVAQMLNAMRPKSVSLQGYIFSRDSVNPLRPDSITRSFQRLLKRHNLPRMRFHDLRHATASILFDNGWSVPDVQHWLGHSDIATTMNIYAAYNSTRKLKIGGALSELFKMDNTTKKEPFKN